jgi:hypothetical protein
MLSFPFFWQGLGKYEGTVVYASGTTSLAASSGPEACKLDNFEMLNFFPFVLEPIFLCDATILELGATDPVSSSEIVP